MQLIKTPNKSQRGITLLESLIAIVVMALGILGIVGVQMRTLADTQTTVRRAQAIRLIEDLSERMKVNPNSLADISGYVTDWSNTPTSSVDCKTSTCNHSDLANYDTAQWKASVTSMLPNGDANVFIAQDDSIASNRRQIGVMISWRENEKSSDSTYLTPINASTGGGSVSCPTGKTCHLQYIPVSARCSPYFGFSAATASFFCAG